MALTPYVVKSIFYTANRDLTRLGAQLSGSGVSRTKTAYFLSSSAIELSVAGSKAQS
jgi:hypothetical protein